MLGAALITLSTGGCTMGDAVPAPPSLFGGGTPVPKMAPAAEQHYLEGKRHLAAGHFGLALEAFRTAVRHDRSSVDALNGLAVTYDSMGRYADARAHYWQALALAPSDPVTLNNLGWSNMLEGRTEIARVYLAQASLHAPDNPIVANNAAQVPAEAPTTQVAMAMPDPDFAAEPPRPAPAAPSEPVPVTFSRAPAAAVERVGPASFRIVGPAQESAPSPERAPAAAAAAAAPVVGCRAPDRLEAPLVVVNGTGRNGQAGRLRSWLAPGAADTVRIANAESWGHERSVLEHAPDLVGAARAIQTTLPFPVRLEEVPGATDLRLVLGHDSLRADRALKAAADPCATVSA